MPTDEPPQPPQPRLIAMTQEDFDRAVAAAVLAISQQQQQQQQNPQARTPPRRPPRGKGPYPGEGSSSHKSPFAQWILEEELPRHFRAPQLMDYTGATDPEDHLGKFENAATLHQYTDAIKCRVFLTTLAGAAVRWFNHLPPASICSFNDFRSSFLRHFATSRAYRKTVMDLFSIKQKSKESLKEYLRRFNQGAQEVPAAPSEVLVSAFSQGLIEGDFFRSLIKKPPENFDMLLTRADKYIHVEEAQSARRMNADTSSHGGPSRQPAPAVRSEHRHPPQPLRRPEPEPPARPAGGPRAIQAVDSRPTQSSGPSRWLPRFCAYHKSRTHDTRDCHQYARVLRESEDQRSRGTMPAPPFRRENSPSSRCSTAATFSSDCPQAPPFSQRTHSPDGVLLTGTPIGPGKHIADSWKSAVWPEEAGEKDPIIGFGPQDLEGVETPHDDALVIKATIANYDISRVFVDTGSSVNIIFKSAFDQMQIDLDDLEPMATSFYGFTGNEVRPLGQIRLAISLGEEPARRTRYCFFTIVDAPSSYNVILGRPTLGAFSAVVSTYHQKIKFPVGDLVGEARGNQTTARRCYVDSVRTEARKTRRTQGAEVHAVQEVPNPRAATEKELLQICPDRPEAVVQVAAELPAELKQELAECLRRNQDVFAWDPTDLTGVSPAVAMHRLNVLPGARPIKQKRRHFGPEQNKVIREEVQKLLKAGYIKEVHFPTWLSNVVLVPKPGNKWRVCVDFRDLNKACPKDCYPLPRIDQLVDSTSGHEYICMLDAYQGYHQIPLAVDDQDKVSFITADGTFCYTVMPFGLKNAGATYQRLMDKIFRHQQGRNIEVYVDDILVKSERGSSLIADVEETCSTLRQYGLKLNPAKCLFGVRVGKFLGYIVTEEGIEANPDKVQALSHMAPPRNLREAQKLMGRITALSRFISRAMERSLPFFKVLKRAQKFEWNADCDKAFSELKEYLSQLPRLAKPSPGEPLFMYLAASNLAASSVLVKQEGQSQHPIYFSSHLFKDAETRYSNLEKLAWMLVLSVRKLRPYFLSHPVTVMTNSNLGRLLTNPEISGRLIKWTVELGEYDIQYQPRTAIKAQALADFLLEMPEGEPEQTWKVYVDGSSNRQGSGVGVVLISPQEEEIRLSIRLSFRTSNNEAEYEAVLAGLQAAKRMGAARVQLYSDSQLVAQQVEGTCEVRNDRLRRYSEAFTKLKAEFREVSLLKIPRTENTKADELARLASSMAEWTDEGHIAQISFVAQIDQSEAVSEPEDWRSPLVNFLQTGATPSDPGSAKVLRRRAARFTLIGDQLYRRAFSRPLLKCLGPEDADYVLREAHQGCCGNHPGGRSLARKILLVGYFWPTLQADAAKLVSPACTARNTKISHGDRLRC
ncbi:uncharacterized protein LOC141816830 [Curcuma longa]|uniref:uncharacterized protein LOC141816830 n=1 Tax=Curcuma longa TaxID=136217 RepID=UPI003D9F068D